jgi:hypothetical protein
MDRFAAKRVAKRILTPTVMALIFPYAIGAQAPKGSGDVFGQCAHSIRLEMKIAACAAASGATSFPWILHWVYRELARAQRDHGERDNAIVSYERSLAAQEDSAVRKEMESLVPLTQ